PCARRPAPLRSARLRGLARRRDPRGVGRGRALAPRPRGGGRVQPGAGAAQRAGGVRPVVRDRPAAGRSGAAPGPSSRRLPGVCNGPHRPQGRDAAASDPAGRALPSTAAARWRRCLAARLGASAAHGPAPRAPVLPGVPARRGSARAAGRRGARPGLPGRMGSRLPARLGGRCPGNAPRGVRARRRRTKGGIMSPTADRLTETVTLGQAKALIKAMAHEQSFLLLAPPGIGKSAVVAEAAAEAGLPCRSLLGTQIAPEDVSGIPRIVGERAVFCPPRVLLPEQPEPFCLFLDELPSCAPDVQKALYSLLLE